MSEQNAPPEEDCEPKQEPGKPGSIGWRECMTPDPAAAISFYTALFGWTTETMPMGDMEYTMLVNDGVPFAGVQGIPPEMGNVPPHWLEYVIVEDAKASEAKILELGGQVLQPSMQIADKGIMVVLADPTGAVIALWQELS